MTGSGAAVLPLGAGVALRKGKRNEMVLRVERKSFYKMEPHLLSHADKI